jgi:putative DNA primase/helicase
MRQTGEPVKDDNIYLLAEAQAKRRKRPRPPPSGDASRPMIRIEAGDLPRAIDQAEAALVARDKNIYSFGSKLVTVVWDDIRVAGGGKEKALRLSVMTEPALLEKFDLAARFEKWNGTVSDFVQCHCPDDIAKRYLARDGNWRVPALLGVVTAPTLRPDGTVLDVPGYDAASGLLFDPLGVDFPPVPERPTKEDAKRALKEIDEVIKHFPFATKAARSVALSLLLSTVSRAALTAVPLHAFDAPVAGSGKSKLADIPSIIATGHRAAAIGGSTARGSDDEFEKKLSASLLSGDQIILIDSVEPPLGGQLLSQVLTQHAVKLRPFGKLQNVTVPSTATIAATGNNLELYGDMPRRTLVCRLDPQTERPELLEFDFEPLARTKERRVSLLTAALTILRAWLSLDKAPEGMPTPLGSFEDYSRVVRNALIWLGEDDPVGVQETREKEDPAAKSKRALVREWWRVLASRPVTVGNVMAVALKEETTDGGDTRRVNPALSDAISVITEGRDASKSLGWWLRHNRDRTITVDGLRYSFRTDEDGKHYLEAVDQLPMAPY